MDADESHEFLIPDEDVDQEDESDEKNGELKGILYLHRDLVESPPSGAYKDVKYLPEYCGDLTISAIDPETGESKIVRSFPIDEYY